MGKRLPVEGLDLRLILDDFDRLLPLYTYIESANAVDKVPAEPLKFRPGCNVKPATTTASQAERVLDVSLRHNTLQLALYRELADTHGEENVGTEITYVPGSSIDVVVQATDGLSFYEIKTASSAKACLREALGQLLEYAYWPGSETPKELVVVGEAPLTNDGKRYVDLLRARFSLPLSYRRISVA